MSEEKKIILYQRYIGLGDTLQFSTLPERYAKLGYKVYVSSKNNYRNQEIFDLVWKHNPYVEGVSDAEPNAGDVVYNKINFFYDNWAVEWEVAHGFTDNFTTYPKVYYPPKYLEDISNVVFYDMNAYTLCYTDEVVKDFYTKLFERYKGYEIRKIEYNNIKNRNTPDFGYQPYRIDSIYDLCNVIYSCKALIGLGSGSCVLASAIKQNRQSPDIISFTPFDRTLYYYSNAEYIVCPANYT